MIQVTECQPLGKGKLQFRFENGMELVLYRGEARQYQLGQDAVIEEAAYETLLREVVGKRATKRTMYLLEKMDRTEAQLREKLTQGGYPPCCIDQAIDYVKSYHYLDDERYAQTYVRYHQEKLSRRQLQMKLMQKGVARDVIEHAIEAEYESDESEQIQALLRKRHFDPSCDQKEFTRTYQYLMRRGFASADVLREMRSYECLER